MKAEKSIASATAVVFTAFVLGHYSAREACQDKGRCPQDNTIALASMISSSTSPTLTQMAMMYQMNIAPTTLSSWVLQLPKMDLIATSSSL